VRRFSQVAVVAVTVGAVTGVVNAYGDSGAVSDLWRVGHGKVVATKILLLAVALGSPPATAGARLRLRQPDTASGAVASFERTGTASWSWSPMVPGRSLALAAKGP
jgi:putative copper export protein